MPAPVDVVVLVAREDAWLHGELDVQLAVPKSSGAIGEYSVLYAGERRPEALAKKLDRAALFLVLVSPDLLVTGDHEDVVTAARAREEKGEACAVLPILLRACAWEETALGAIEPLPASRAPVASGAQRSDGYQRDEAWRDVARGVMEAAARIASMLAPSGPSAPSAPSISGGSARAVPRAPPSESGRAAEEAPSPSRPSLSQRGPRDPRPSFPDEETRRLSEELDVAIARRRDLRDAGADTSEADREIATIKGRLRKGGQLRAGDSLGGGRWLLLERIGKGGFAVVWRALDRDTGSEAAVKVLHAELAGDPVRLERFRRGARRMAELGGEGIVPVIAPRGEDEGFHYLVMELIDGGDLRRAVLNKRVAREAVIPLLLRVCAALDRAHAAGIVHRDIKPANILLDARGEPWLTDFDLVGADADSTGGTRTEAALGTMIYAAPELLLDAPTAGHRVDIYGLGMTAIFCMRGKELRELPMQGVPRILEEIPASEAVRAVLRRAVATEPEERFGSAAAFGEALQEAAALDAESPREREKESPREKVGAREDANASASERESERARASGLSAAEALQASGLRSTKRPRAPFSNAQVIGLLGLFLSVGMAAAIGILSSPPPAAPTPARGAGFSLKAVSSFIPLPPSAQADPEAAECPPSMALIQSATFTMGSLDSAGPADEQPPHAVTLSAYCIDKAEVTVKQFEACTAAAKEGPPCEAPDEQGAGPSCNWKQPGRAAHPMNCVTWAQASAYCAWTGGRLPTEAEWEYAAAGPKRNVYPWGSAAPSAAVTNACGTECSRYTAAYPRSVYYLPDKWRETAPSEALKEGASSFGVLAMAGNVREWVFDWYAPYGSAGLVNPKGPEIPPMDTLRVVRGGAFNDTDPSELRTTRRVGYNPLVQKAHLGFRCVRDLVARP
jgi:formylglycine-generating enzyme required for sulfatase activity